MYIGGYLMEDYVFEAKSFIDYLTFIKEHYHRQGKEFWYRGHRNHQWELKPNIYRDASINEKLVRENYTLNYHLINFYEEFLKLKNRIRNDKLYDISTLNDFNIMLLAQHHGFATPVLDWTSDPLTALFFAIDEYEYTKDIYPVVYIFNPGWCNQHSYLHYTSEETIEAMTEPINTDDLSNEFFKELTYNLNETSVKHIPIAIYTESHFSYRIIKQSGKFTFHGPLGPLDYRWNDIVIENKKFADKIKIHPKMIQEAKDYLNLLNINKKSVYANYEELDKSCRVLKENAYKILEQRIKEQSKKREKL